MNGDVWVQSELDDVSVHEVLDGPARHRSHREALIAAPTCCQQWSEERSVQIVSDAAGIQPAFQALNGLSVKRDAAFLSALAVNLQDAVAASGLVAAGFGDIERARLEPGADNGVTVECPNAYTFFPVPWCLC